MPAIWFKKREYRLNEPSSFSLSPVTIRHNENGGTSEVTTWCGYDVMCDVEIMSDAVKGTVSVTFPESHNDVVPVFVLVIYNVTINGVEHGPFQQLTRDTTTSIVWREEALSEEERNGVRIQVRVIELHC